MINVPQLKDFIIIPTLEYLDLYSQSAVNLLLGTCAQESTMGDCLLQIHGPAQGIYQMEPQTERLVRKWLVKNNPGLYSKIISGLIPYVDEQAYNICNMTGNLYYATAMARVLYLSIPEPLPEADDIEGMANYWKQYYNTPKGAGTVEEFKANYATYVAPYI